MIAMATDRPSDALDRLQRLARWQDYKAGDLVIPPGTERLLLVQEGHLQVEIPVGEDSFLSIGILAPGRLFGAHYALQRGAHGEAWLHAMTRCRVGWLPSHLVHDPEHAPAVMRSLAHYLSMLESSRCMAVGLSCERVLAALLFLRDYAGREVAPGMWEIPFHLTHERLSSFTGNSRETVTRALADLIAAKAIEVPEGRRLTRLHVRRIQQVTEARRREWM